MATYANSITINLSLLDNICKHSPELITNKLLLLFVPLLKFNAKGMQCKPKPLIDDVIHTLYNLFTYKHIKPFNTKSVDFNFSLYDPPLYPIYNIADGSLARIYDKNAVTYDQVGTFCDKTTSSKFSLLHLTTNVSYELLEPLMIALITECIPHMFTPKIVDCDDSIGKALELAAIISTHASDTVWRKYIPQLCSAIVVRKDMYNLDLYETEDSFPPVKTLDCQNEWIKRGNVKLRRDRKLLPQLISSIVSKNYTVVSDSLKNSLITISLRPYPPLGPHILSCGRDLDGVSLDKFYLFASVGIVGALSYMENEITKSTANVENLGKLTPPLVAIMKFWSGSKNKYIHYGINRLVMLVDEQVGKILAKAFNYDAIVAGNDTNPIPWGTKLLKNFMNEISTYRLTHLPLSIASYLIVYSFDLENLVSSNVSLFKKASIITGFDRIPGRNLLPLAKFINSIRLPQIAYPFLLSHIFTSTAINHYNPNDNCPTSNGNKSITSCKIATSSIDIMLRALNMDVNDLPISPNELFRASEDDCQNNTFKRLQLAESLMEQVGLKNMKELIIPTKWFYNKNMRIPLLYIAILISEDIATAIISNMLSLDGLENDEFSLFKDLFDDLLDESDSQLIPIASILAYKCSYGNECDKYFQIILDTSARKTSSFSIFTTAHVGKRNNFIRRLSIIALGLEHSDLWVKEDEFVAITRSDRVWRYFIEELPKENVIEIKRCFLFSISQILNKNFLKFPNFPHLELIFEFPMEALNIVSSLVLMGVKIPNLPSIVAKFMNLSSESVCIDKIFEYISNINVSGYSDDMVTEFVCKLIYETISNDYNVESLSNYPIITRDHLYKILINRQESVDTVETFTKWHVVVMTKLALVGNKFSQIYLEKLLLISGNLTLAECSEALDYLALAVENRVAESCKVTVEEILRKFIIIPKAMHYIYTLRNITPEFKLMIISIVDAELLVKIIKWEIEMDYIEKTDATIAKKLLYNCVCSLGVVLLVKSINKLTNDWMVIFDNYAVKYPNKLSFQLAKAKKSYLLYYLHRKIYYKCNTNWIMCYMGDVIDKYLAKTLILVVSRITTVRVYPVCKTITKMALKTLESGACSLELLKLAYKLLKINHSFTYKYITRLLIVTSQLLDKESQLLSMKHATRLFKYLFIRILSLAKFQIDHVIHSTHFLRVFVKFGVNGGNWLPIISKLRNKLLNTTDDMLKLRLVTFLQLFFSSECWDFGAVDEDERRKELQLVISQKKKHMVTRVFYQSFDDSKNAISNNINNFIHLTSPKFANGDTDYIKGHKINLGMVSEICHKKNMFFVKMRNKTDTLDRMVAKYVDRHIRQLETVPHLCIPENKCSSDKLYKLNLITFFTTLSSGYDVEKYSYDLGKCSVPSMVLCVDILTKIESSDSLVTNALNIAVCKQICQVTKSGKAQLQMDAIRAIGRIVNGYKL